MQRNVKIEADVWMFERLCEKCSWFMGLMQVDVTLFEKNLVIDDTSFIWRWIGWFCSDEWIIR